jgi:cyanophycin synthetase
LKGIDTLEDLAWVKSVVVEAVKRRGTSVLNADDPLVAGMRRRAGGRIAYFSLKGGVDMPDFLREHIEGGGLAVIREPGLRPGGEITIYDDGESFRVISAAEIPATLEGLAEFNIQNALGAIAMCYARGVGPRAIRSALSGFASTFDQCPGRLNIYDAHGFRVILDYAHNPAGLTALGEMVRKMRPRYRRAIGMVNIPGDRRDEDILTMGRLAACFFDEIIFREDPARRGRQPGEIVGLLARGAIEAGFPAERVRRILDESQAADVCLGRAEPGDLVVLTPTDVETMWERVLTFKGPDLDQHHASREDEAWRKTA